MDLDAVIGPSLSSRFVEELSSALRRRPAHEPLLAAAIYVLLPFSERLAEASAAAADVLVRRGSMDRPLFRALLRGLAERKDARMLVPLVRALESEACDLTTLTTAAFMPSVELAGPLAKQARSRSSHVAFAAEVARAARGDSEGEMLIAIAPRIKEVHRIELISNVVLPLASGGRVIRGCGAAFAVLRGAERHLGRWLCLAEGARLAGDNKVLAQANANLLEGASGARAGWGLLAWALSPAGTKCEYRPTLELVARLSDRPSSERELSFLFRMADAGQACAKAMLESLTKQTLLETEAAIRASIYLIRDYGFTALLPKLVEIAKSTKREKLRGLAIAALFETGSDNLTMLTLEQDRSRNLAVALWSALVRMALAKGRKEKLLTEQRYRMLQLGWPD